MEVEARMAGEPSLDPRMFVSGVVIGDQVSVKFGGNGRISIDYPRGPKTGGLDGGAK